MSEQAKQTPLVDLLRQVPADFRCEWESDWAEDGRCTGHNRGPVGRYCHEAAAEIERLNKIEAAAKALYFAGHWGREGSLAAEDVPLWDALKDATSWSVTEMNNINQY